MENEIFYEREEEWIGDGGSSFVLSVLKQDNVF